MTLQTLLELIRCPRCKSPLVRDGDWLVSTDPACRLRFEIKDNIPILIPELASPVDTGEWSQIMSRTGRDAASGVALGDK